MNAATNLPQLIPTLPCDAAIPDLRIGGFEPLAPLPQVFAGWRDQIASESLYDMALDFRALSMRPEDGALIRTGGKAALAYTRHGSSQLLALLLTEKPANLNNVLRWIKPAQRAPVFNMDVRDRSKRNPEDKIVVRTVALAVPGQADRIRAIRAVVSTRHALKHLDDLALANALQAELGDNVEASVVRSVDVTHGYASVDTGSAPALRRSIHWRNSETGIASLSFSAGAIIVAVDAPIRLTSGEEIDGTAIIAAANESARVRHTSPGGKAGDEDLKARIALDRMRAGIRKALASGDDLAAQWDRALASFPTAKLQANSPSAWEVLLDAAEERISFSGDDRASLMKIISNDARLKALPHGSAAHMAAAFALLGRFATSAEESVRLQGIAGAWLVKCWA